MASVTLENIPDDLLQRLKRSAEQSGRSLSSEAILRLERALAAESAGGAAARLERIREVRRKASGVYLTDADLRAARDEGRP